MKRNLIVVLSTVIALFLFQSCAHEDDPQPLPQNRYLTGVITERHYTKADLIGVLNSFIPGMDFAATPVGALICDVDIAAITYTTTGVDGKKVEASGIVAMCSDTESYDNLLSVQHITLDQEEAPSKMLFNLEIVPVFRKRIVVMADYLGYGVSETPTRQHPYLHIATTGTACADMIEAAREYLHDKGIRQNSDQVELLGYSQGGTSTIATLIELTKRGQSSLIASVHAGGGAYDLIGVLNRFIAEGNTLYSRSGYSPYLIRGMEYGEQLVLDQSKIYAPRLLNEGILKQLDVQPLSAWHEILGQDLTQVIHPDFYAPNFNGNKDIHKLMAALEKNSLITMDLPDVPITLYHSKMDDIIPYANAEAAHAKWKGSKLVVLTSKGHVRAGVEFMLRYLGFFS
ncbi:MAG: lipase family protein [Tannerellaceae bacterium]